MIPAFYVVARETWDIIEECSSFAEARAAYSHYEAIDRKEETFEPDFYEIIKAPKGLKTLADCDDLTVVGFTPHVIAHKTIRSGGRSTLLINITEECKELGLRYNDRIKVTIEPED